ncbi:RodZ domain-containing protein [Paenibacillus sp. GCM10023252]|uniref:RodZ domain-containing protein n=1 Tax=Paenibacillus sp. GCM10023252 TaxID=3252649 RepID=UPI00361B98FE
MSDLGALLRRAREEHGLTLDDVQETTKIRKRYLEAIESGDHSVLPGSFYVRAFIKNYSEAVGLNPDEVLRLYQHEVPSAPVEPSLEPTSARPPRRVQAGASDRMGRIGFNIMMWSFLILILVVVYIFIINNNNGTEKADENTPITDNASPTPTPQQTEGTSDDNSANPTVSPTPSPTPTPAQSATTVTFSQRKGKVEHYEVAPAGTHKVEIKVSGGPNWVEVRTGSNRGEKLEYKTVPDGTILSYDLTQPIYINVGRADLVQLLVDGVVVPDGDEANSKKVQLNPAVDTAASPSPGGDTPAE